MRFHLPLSPMEAAAFLCLGLLDGEDLQRLAMQWLEGGAESPNVAVLASEPSPTLRDDLALFERCLADMGASFAISESRAGWLVMRVWLSAVKAGEIRALDATREIIAQLDCKGIRIFPGRNLSLGARPLAGAELGIEHMLGILWGSDEDLMNEPDLDRELKVEALRVLDALFSAPQTTT